MYVKDWMTKNPISLSKEDSVLDAKSVMSQGNFHRVPICENGNIVGLITRSTIKDYSPSIATSLSVYEINSLLQKAKCVDVMIKNPVVIDEDALLEEAADKMLANNITCLPVVQKGTNRLVGIITQKTMFGAFVDLMGYYSNGTRVVIEVSEDTVGVLEKLSGVLARANVSISNMAVYHFDKILIVCKVIDMDGEKITNLLKSNGYIVADCRVIENA